MNWEEVKNDRSHLKSLLEEYGTRGLARKVGEARSTVHYYKRKHAIGSFSSEDTPEENNSSEQKPQITFENGTYTIVKNDKELNIPYKQYARIRKDYTGRKQLTIEQITRKHPITKQQFKLLKSAFDFTHHSIPYTDKEIMEKTQEEMIKETIARRKTEHFDKLKQKELDNLFKELEKYREEDYKINNIHEIISKHFSKIDSIPKIDLENKTFTVENDLMLEIPIVDLHLDKLSWKPETGEEYNLDEAKKRFVKVIKSVLGRTKEKDFDKILFPIGNDFFHYDDMDGHTTRGTIQDFESRWQKMFKVGVELLAEGIRLLAKRAPVDVFLVPGNHDKEKSFYALMYLDGLFDKFDQVKIDVSPKTRKYRRFGNNLIGFSHMDEESNRIYGNMQMEVPKLWGKTKYREWHGAHLHSEQVDEKFGIIVRNLSSVTAKDSWHYKKGYKSLAKSQSFIWHKEKGLRNILVTTID